MFRGTSLYLLLLIIIIFVVTTVGKDVEQVKELSVTEFLINLENSNVESIVTVGGYIKGKLVDGTQYTFFDA